MTEHTGRTVDDRIRRALDALDDEDVQLQTPPAGLWDAIEADIVADTAAGEGAAGAASSAPAPESMRVVSPSRRRKTATAVLGVAAAAVVLGVALVSSGTLPGQAPLTQVAGATDKPSAAEPVAVAQLAPLESGVEGTTAELLDASTMVLQPDLVMQAGSYYEVWLLDEAAQSLVSLGPLREDGRYTIPDGVTIDEFPVVDVSIELPDGNPAHSGRSVLRGTLT
ncbi:anti-sigma factor [Euzebya tangerina]|uniref:anti-sigma factor n=1 Tax=Euzebya tangerina TaxID=591198 RepID=UPI000E31A18F|nr:anti-sigma factor [Euzebya tangerina]